MVSFRLNAVGGDAECLEKVAAVIFVQITSCTGVLVHRRLSELFEFSCNVVPSRSCGLLLQFVVP